MLRREQYLASKTSLTLVHGHKLNNTTTAVTYLCVPPKERAECSVDVEHADVA